MGVVVWSGFPGDVCGLGTNYCAGCRHVGVAKTCQVEALCTAKGFGGSAGRDVSPAMISWEGMEDKAYQNP